MQCNHAIYVNKALEVETVSDGSHASSRLTVKTFSSGKTLNKKVGGIHSQYRRTDGFKKYKKPL